MRMESSTGPVNQGRVASAKFAVRIPMAVSKAETGRNPGDAHSLVAEMMHRGGRDRGVRIAFAVRVWMPESRLKARRSPGDAHAPVARMMHPDGGHDRGAKKVEFKYGTTPTC